MFRWIPYAFVRIILFFSAGIMLAIYFPGILDPFLAAIIFLGLAMAYVIVVRLGHGKSLIAGCIAVSTLLLGGIVNVKLKDESQQLHHLTRLDEKVVQYKAVITKPAQESVRTWKFEVNISKVRTSHQWIDCHSRAVLYLPRQNLTRPLNYGDVLLIKGSPQRVPSPLNPGEFDYRQFMAYKQIYFQHFLSPNNVMTIGRNPDGFMQYPIAARLWADSVLRKYVPGKREQGLASALILGVTDGLDKELIDAYASSGAMHVLSVSGLHVGIVYWLVTLLFRPFQKVHASKYILLSTSLIALWAYAFVTGISPSVLRAVTMFSFVAVAKPLAQQTNIYNILAASAFCLLVYDPFMIMFVGFQLSYLAVIGIVAIQPVLYRLWEPTNWLLDEIWKIAAVSMAAQLATVSIGLYYFHQFPNYFLITNLFVIPGSFIVLIIGIGMLVGCMIIPLVEIMGTLLHWIIKIINSIVFAIDQLPFSVIDMIYINVLQCWIGILIVWILFMLVESRRLVWFTFTGLLLILFSAISWLHFKESVMVNQVTVYAIPGSTALDLASDGRIQFVGDTTLIPGGPKATFHMLPNRLMMGATKIVENHVPSTSLTGCTLFYWKGVSILQIHDLHYRLPQNLYLDLVILSNNSVRRISDISSRLRTNYFVLDSSNSHKLSAAVLEQCKALNLKAHAVLCDGAYKLKF